MKKTKMISMSEYARRRGLSPGTVSRQAAEGKIPLHDGKIDPAEADKARAKNISLERGRKAKVPSHSKVELELQFARERVRKLEMANDVAAGKLVNAAGVESSVEARFRRDAEALLAWPTSVAAEMAAELGVPEPALAIALNRSVREFMRERSMVGPQKEQA